MPEGQLRPIDWEAVREQLRAAAIAAVIVFNIVNAYAIASGDWAKHHGIQWLLLDTEGNASTWFSSVILLVAGVCAVGTGLVGPEVRQRFWLAIGAILVVMSVEEVAQFHELVSGNLTTALDGGGVTAVWVVPGAVAVAVVMVVLVRIAPPLDRDLIARLFLGVTLFVLGALGFELLGGEIYPDPASDERGVLVLATLEENLELAGGLVLAWTTSGVLLELERSRRAIRA